MRGWWAAAIMAVVLGCASAGPTAPARAPAPPRAVVGMQRAEVEALLGEPNAVQVSDADPAL